MEIRCCRILLQSEGLKTVESIIEAIFVKSTHAALIVFGILYSDDIASSG